MTSNRICSSISQSRLYSIVSSLESEEDFREVASFAMLPPPSNSSSTTPSVTQPNLDEIPRLILVDLQKDNLEEIEQALKNLRQRINHGSDVSREEMRKDALLVGAPGVIIRNMQRWRRCPSIQVYGCQCLTNLSYSVLERKIAVVNSGGVEAMVDAMKSLPEYLAVQHSAINALANILSRLPDVTKRFVEEWQGLELIVRAQKRFLHDVGMQRSCCRIFFNLAFDSDIKEELYKAGAISSVGIAIEHHSEDVEVRRLGTKFMNKLFPQPVDHNGNRQNQALPLTGERHVGNQSLFLGATGDASSAGIRTI